MPKSDTGSSNITRWGFHSPSGSNFSHLGTDFAKVASVPAFQRLGYLLDQVLQETSVADGLMELIKHAGLKFKTVPLKSGAPTDDSPICERWKVIVNQQIETDDL